MDLRNVYYRNNHNHPRRHHRHIYLNVTTNARRPLSWLTIKQERKIVKRILKKKKTINSII